MAVFFPSNQAYGPIAFNADMTASAPAPTEMYIYLNAGQYICEAEMRDYGFTNKAGTITDGRAVDALQATTTDADTSTATLELDDDTGSPYKGALRIKFTMA
jgi:hypothetical protein